MDGSEKENKGEKGKTGDCVRKRGGKHNFISRYMDARIKILVDYV